MTFTGLTPLLDSLRAAGVGIHFFDPRSGSLRSLTSAMTFAGYSGAGLNRGGAFLPTIDSSYFESDINNTFTSGELTVICCPRITKEGSANFTAYVYNRNGTTAGFLFYHTSALKKPTFTVQNATTAKTITSTTITLPINEKAVISVSYKDNDASGLTLYKNGSSIAAAVSTVGFVMAHASASKIRIGMNPGAPTVSRTGTEDFVLVINKYLTPAEHAKIYDEIVNQIVYEKQSMIVNSTFATLGGDVYRACYGILAGELTMSAGQSIGQLDALKVSTGTHKMNTFLYNGQLAKGIKCVTAGNIVLPDPRPTLGTTWAYRYYDDSAATWESRTSATATVALDAVNDIILWATADGRTCLRKY